MNEWGNIDASKQRSKQEIYMLMQTKVSFSILYALNND